MMYRNATDGSLAIERATGAITIASGETAAIAPIVAAPYLDQGHLELVTAEDTESETVAVPYEKDEPEVAIATEPEKKPVKRDRTTSKSETEN